MASISDIYNAIIAGVQSVGTFNTMFDSANPGSSQAIVSPLSSVAYLVVTTSSGATAYVPWTV